MASSIRLYRPVTKTTRIIQTLVTMVGLGLIIGVVHLGLLTIGG